MNKQHAMLYEHPQAWAKQIRQSILVPNFENWGILNKYLKIKYEKFLKFRNLY